MPRLGFDRASRPPLQRRGDLADVGLDRVGQPLDVLRAFSDVSASARTSSATTAKPRPWSPARAASIAAFKRQKVGLVRDAADRSGDLADILGAASSSRDDLHRRALALRRCARSRAPSGDLRGGFGQHGSTASVRRREASAFAARDDRLVHDLLDRGELFLRAPAASSAPLAICSIARRSSSAAADASVRPLASSSVAAATARRCGLGAGRRAWPRRWGELGRSEPGAAPALALTAGGGANGSAWTS